MLTTPREQQLRNFHRQSDPAPPATPSQSPTGTQATNTRVENIASVKFALLSTINRIAVPDKRSKTIQKQSSQSQRVDEELFIEEDEGEDAGENAIVEFDAVDFGNDLMEFSQEGEEGEYVEKSEQSSDVVKEMVWGDDFEEMLET